MGWYVAVNPPLVKCNKTKQLTSPGSTEGMKTKPNYHELTPKDQTKTKLCGEIYAGRGLKPKKAVGGATNKLGQWACPVCKKEYVYPLKLREHFERCAERCGNLADYNWDDDPSVPWMDAGMEEYGRK